MVRRLLIRLAGRLLAAPIRRRLAEFERATQKPEITQLRLLRRILHFQQTTGFGRDHGFAQITNFVDFRRHVPILTYEHLAPYIERVRKGDIRALVADPIVHMFALTSGTTAARKLIPITPSYLADYRRGWNIWGMRAMKDHRPIILKPIMQLVGDHEEFHSEAGIPCGNLSGLTARMQRPWIRRLYTVPACTGKIQDARTRYYVALLFSLRRPVGMLLAANPSTLVALARTLDQEKESLLRDLHDGSLASDLQLPDTLRKQLQSRLKAAPELSRQFDQQASHHGHLFPSSVWPPDRLLIGTWTGGSVGLFARLISRYYAETPIRDLGLLASEGRMTLPLEDHTPGGVLDITSHVFDFIPEAEIEAQHPTVLNAHELQLGHTYYILPTTSAGLYRYHISDLVRVTGFFHRTPVVEFLGKGHRFASLTGEKLSEYHVTEAMAEVLQRIPHPISAYTLAPCWNDQQPYYGLFLEEGDLSSRRQTELFLRLFDRILCQRNIEYASKRDSGRLGPVRIAVLPEGTWQRWDRERLAHTGGSPEQYKRPCLMGDPRFQASMPVLHEVLLSGETSEQAWTSLAADS